MTALKYARLKLIARIAESTAKVNGLPKTGEKLKEIRGFIDRRNEFSEETHTGQLLYRLEGPSQALEAEASEHENRIQRAIETCRSWEKNEFRIMALEARQCNGAMREDVGRHLQSEVPFARIDEESGVKIEIIPQDKFKWLKKWDGIRKTLGGCFGIALIVEIAGIVSGAYSLRDMLLTGAIMLGIGIAKPEVKKKLREFPTLRPAEQILGLIRRARDNIRKDIEAMKRILEDDVIQPERSTEVAQ